MINVQERSPDPRLTQGIMADGICISMSEGIKPKIMESGLFEVINPGRDLAPILLSIPHAGVEFPAEVIDYFDPSITQSPIDTDWFVDRLYDFASDLGITVIRARLSRYVIDLNRDPRIQPLYSDGRVETALIPQTTFLGENILRKPVAQEESQRRLQHYYWPYYQKIQEILGSLQDQFQSVLFFDAHSIRRYVPTIRQEPFPDLILGNQDGRTASPKVIESALSRLNQGLYKLSHNDPFKGGHLTRYFGAPEKNIHALQLEMAQEIYMDEDSVRWNPAKAAGVQSLLKNLLSHLIEILGKQ